MLYLNAILSAADSQHCSQMRASGQPLSADLQGQDRGRECTVLYLSASDYPNSQVMAMCTDDDELNTKLEKLMEIFEYGARLNEVVQQVLAESV